MSSKYDIIILTGDRQSYMESRLAQLKQPAYLTYGGLLDLYRDYKNPKDKVKNLFEKGEIRRVRRDLYLLGSHYRPSFSKMVLANLVYGPSAVSFESALGFHGLIPERIETIQSICFKRNKRFQTPLGTFVYRYISVDCFPLGIEYLTTEEGNFFIASKEKAVCDIAYFARIDTVQSALTFALADLRIDEADLRELDRRMLLELARTYRKKSVSHLVDAILTIQNEGGV